MTAKEFKLALSMALTDDTLESGSIDVFDGCGLRDFRYPIYVTIRQLARFVRWQCVCIDGYTIDQNELATIREIGKRKFQVIP